MKIPPCQECGACCVPQFEYDVYAQVTPNDACRLPKKYRLQVVNGALKTRYAYGGCRCTALVGKVLQSVRCDIYTARPKVCRDFKRGSEGCRQALREAM